MVVSLVLTSLSASSFLSLFLAPVKVVLVAPLCSKGELSVGAGRYPSSWRSLMFELNSETDGALSSCGSNLLMQ